MGTQSTWGQNEETLSTHHGRSETKKVTDKEPTRPVRNTRTWMKTTSYGKTKQHLFVGLLLGVIVLSTQAQALSIEQAPICCSAYDAQCESCKQGLSEKEYCRRNPYVTGCEKYQNGGGSKPFPCCRANNARCLSCAAGLSEEEYCKKNPSTGGCEKYRNCCQAYNAKCESCKQGISEEEYCKKAPTDFFGAVQGCEKYQNGGGSGKGCCKANTADCLACSAGKSVKKFCKKKRNRDVPGCEKYHKGDGGNFCCKAHNADCLSCSAGKSVKRFCKKNKNRDIPGCEKYHRRGSWGKKDRDDRRQQGDRDDSRLQGDRGFFNWFG